MTKTVHISEEVHSDLTNYLRKKDSIQDFVENAIKEKLEREKEK